MESINRLADEIEGKAINSPQKEISTTEIGELVLLGLWKIDEVAYVRFASVYRDFDSLETFIAALNELKEKRLEEALTPDLTEDAPEGEEA